jgi:hypothetical protein
MNPKPPFATDLTREAEIAAFRELQPRLLSVWEALTMRDFPRSQSVP